MGLHWWDMLVVVALGLLVFGPKRLPEMGASLGKTIREFQKSMREVTDPEPPSSVPPSALQTAQPVAPAPAPAPVIEAAPQAATTTAIATEATATEAATTERSAGDSAEPQVEQNAIH